MKRLTQSPKQIALFTDFGVQGPYIGQIKAVLHSLNVVQPIYELISDAPTFAIKASAYLLASLVEFLPESTLVIAVVDPGVGGDRLAIVVEADDHIFVGPDNGLLSQVVSRAQQSTVSIINWRPEALSNSFHGRDLFAPVAAMMANQQPVSTTPMDSLQLQGALWDPELAEVIYIDHFGNAICGIRVSQLPIYASVSIAGRQLPGAATFSEVARGAAFWYQNSMGLLEVSVNQGRADQQLGIRVGSKLQIS